MVREDDIKQKKGWFSRKTSGTQTPVSRPPSASTYAKKPPSSTKGTDDDELPPRLSSSTPTATPPTSPHKEGHTSTPSDPEIKIPKTAGFDLAAMKEIIGSAGKEPQVVRALSPVPLPPPSNRTESMPQVPQVRRSPSPMAGPSTPKKELPDSFARSMTLEDDEDVDHRRSPKPPSSPYSNPIASASSTTTTSDSWGEPAPRGGFGYAPFGASSSSLAQNPFSNDPVPKSSGFAYSSPFGGSAASLAGNPFGGSTASLAGNPFAGGRSFSSPLPPPPPPQSGGLSFGGMDGSITSVGVDDPWAAPNDFGRKRNGNEWVWG